MRKDIPARLCYEIAKICLFPNRSLSPEVKRSIKVEGLQGTYLVCPTNEKGVQTWTPQKENNAERRERESEREIVFRSQTNVF
jgi:hypothetical protein